jgi:hypothetical protein
MPQTARQGDRFIRSLPFFRKAGTQRTSEECIAQGNDATIAGFRTQKAEVRAQDARRAKPKPIGRPQKAQKEPRQIFCVTSLYLIALLTKLLF